MSVGSILIGVALGLVLVAYIARPFREQAPEAEQLIEAWVAEARRTEAPVSTRAPAAVSPDVEPSSPSPPVTPPASPDQSAAEDADVMNFCPQCGRRLEPDHRFCPGCGTRLR